MKQKKEHEWPHRKSTTGRTHTIEWISVDERLPEDEVEIMVCDAYGYISITERDQYGYFGRNCERIDKEYPIMYWSYLPKLPMDFPNATITNDLWVAHAAKQKLLKKIDRDNTEMGNLDD